MQGRKFKYQNGVRFLVYAVFAAGIVSA